MNRRLFLGCLGAIQLGITNFGVSAAEQSSKPKSIVIYFSRSGHVEELAKNISELTGSQMIKLEPAEAYPSSYSETVDIVKEQMTKGVVPPIKPVDVNLNNYDVIFIGSPTWWGHISRPVERFLSDYKFKGKKVMLFTSHGGSGVAHTKRDVQRLCPGNEVPESIGVYGGSSGDRSELDSWIKKHS